jgi:serine/threonine protein kinase
MDQAELETLVEDAKAGKMYGKGRTPLHRIMQSGKEASVDDVRAVLEAQRGAVEATARNSNKIPLHFGMSHGARPESVQLLVKEWPDSVKQKDSFGRVPLATGIEYQAPVESLKCLFDAWPQGVLEADWEGFTPLHKEMCMGFDSAFILYMAKKFEHDHAEQKSDCSESNQEISTIQDLDPYMVSKVFQEFLTASDQPEWGRSPLDFLIDKIVDLQESRSLGKPLEIWSQLALRVLFRGIGRSHLLDGRNYGRIDGLRLRKLCTRRNPFALQSFFFAFGEQDNRIKSFFFAFGEEDNKATEDDNLLPRQDEAMGGSMWPLPTLDLNSGIDLRLPSVLEVLIDLDTYQSGKIFESILNQLSGNHESRGVVTIRCFQEPSHPYVQPLVKFKYFEKPTNKTMEKLAERARLSYEVRFWGESFGRFLKQYRIDKDEAPKHKSATCVVQFATEVRTIDGEKKENKVALKFMYDRRAFVREIQKRDIMRQKSGTEFNSCVMGVKAAYTMDSKEDFGNEDFNGTVPQFGVTAIESDLRGFDMIRLNQDSTSGRVAQQLRHVLVMDRGGLDLHNVVSSQDIAGKKLPFVLHVVMSIAKCLQFMNETCGLIHGDVKASNFVSTSVGGDFLAIDLDNAALIGKEKAGQKRTSSGYLPPEQAAVELYERSKLENEESRKTKLKEAEDEVSRLRAALQSLLNANAPEETIDHTFEACQNARQRVKEFKYREPVESDTASVAYDMWCFGVLIYYLFVNKQLFHMDGREDVDDKELRLIVNWDEKAMEEKIGAVPEHWPRRLLRRLLQRRPRDRPNSWAYVLDELQQFVGNSNRSSDGISIDDSIDSAHGFSAGKQQSFDKDAC